MSNKRCVLHRFLLLLLSTVILLRFSGSEVRADGDAELAISTRRQGLVELSTNNLESTLKSAQVCSIFYFKSYHIFQVVFVAFCADWCPFSRRLKPVFEESAKKWQSDYPNSHVIWAVVDSVAQADVAEKYFVNKYPTMKVFLNGELLSKEYRYAT